MLPDDLCNGTGRAAERREHRRAEGETRHAASPHEHRRAAGEAPHAAKLRRASLPACQSFRARALAFDAPSTRLYVACGGSNGVFRYAIARDCRLSALDPASVSTSGGPIAIELAADGRTLYTANPGTSMVLQFAVGPGGHPDPLVPRDVVSGSLPTSLAVSPVGGFVWSLNASDETVTQFVADAEGALSSDGTTPIDLECILGTEFECLPQQIAVDPSGETVYASLAPPHDSGNMPSRTASQTRSIPRSCTPDFPGISRWTRAESSCT